jgi:hypothetical protein
VVERLPKTPTAKDFSSLNKWVFSRGQVQAFQSRKRNAKAVFKEVDGMPHMLLRVFHIPISPFHSFSGILYRAKKYFRTYT